MNPKTKRQLLREYAYDLKRKGWTMKQIEAELVNRKYPGRVKQAVRLAKNAVDHY